MTRFMLSHIRGTLKNIAGNFTLFWRYLKKTHKELGLGIYVYMFNSDFNYLSTRGRWD